MTTNEYQVSGMNCGHCEASVREELSKVGLTDVRIDLQSGRVAVTSPAPIDDASVIDAVEEAGYTAVRA